MPDADGSSGKTIESEDEDDDEDDDSNDDDDDDDDGNDDVEDEKEDEDEVIPESEDEDACEARHTPSGSQSRVDNVRDNVSVGTSNPAANETHSKRGTSKQPPPEDGPHKKEGAEGQGSFGALLTAVRSAESMRLLDLSRNGLTSDQCTRLKEAFGREGELDSGWNVGFLRRV